MNQDALRHLFDHVAPTVLYDESLSRHTSWRIGGPADILVIPSSISQLQQTMQLALGAGVPWFILGRGSNVLVKDGGIRGVVIKLLDTFADIDVLGEHLTAFAGRALSSAAHVAIRNGLSGLEFATGIPGTVGGGVTMNAGANGSEIKDVFQSAQVLDATGNLLELDCTDMEFAYRHSVVRSRRLVVVSATFALHVGDVAEMQSLVRAWGQKRLLTQPLSFPSCGSVFRNPPGNFSAQLIEAAGLKGSRIGDAEVSSLHANFIINSGQATARDVLALMAKVQETVKEQFNIELIPEVRVVGEDET